MFVIDKELEDYIYNPLIILTLKDKDLIDRLNNCLPYSTGIELECPQKSNFKREYFTEIPNIISVNCDSMEQRFRIPNGINGLICLYNICTNLALYCELNPINGNHLHIDCSESNIINKIKQVYKTDEEFSLGELEILEELQTWNYKGTYNKGTLALSKYGWFCLRTNTIEIRICEMSFDYKVLINRILHSNSLVKNLKIKHDCYVESTFSSINSEQIISYFKNHNLPSYSNLVTATKKLEELKTKEEIQQDNIKEIIKKRVIKL